MRIIILIISILITLSGCWDKHEIEEEAFVVVIGLDDLEKKDGISVTYQIANPQAGIPNTGGEGEDASEIITLSAPDFISAKDLANATVTRKITYAHTKVIVIGEEFAKKEKALKFLLSGIRDREIRRGIKIIISKEKAADFIRNNDPKLETRPHKYYELMIGRWIDTGLVPISDLKGFLHRLESKTDGYLVTYASSEKSEAKKNGDEDNYLSGQIDQKGGNQTQMIGSALFNNGIMIAILTGEETRLAHNLRPKLTSKYMRVTYPDPLNPEYRIAAFLSRNKNTNIDVLTDEDPLIINVTLPLDFEILAIPSGENYVTNLENQEKLRKQIEDSLEQKFKEIVKKSQEDFKTNPFNWSNVARKNFLTIQEYESYDFEKKYLSAEVNVKVDVKFIGFGKQLAPPNYKKTEDE